MVKVNESRYIALFVVTRFIKKLFNYLVFLNIFFKKICQARQCRVTPHCLYLDSKNSHQRCSVKKSVLRNFAKFIGKHLCQRLAACNFIKKGTVAQVFSCEFCEIFKNTYFTEHVWTTASLIH